MSQVVLYGTRFCPYCTAARHLLSAKGVNYEDISVDSDMNLRREIMEKSGQRTVPQIWIGEKHVGGYSELQQIETLGQLDALLKNGVELDKTDAI
ncbi:MAG: glutaredoxin 3 [Porticoccaceae bacterium]|jgi:glutaredoxin 3|nr:glutaredoxin 3 [Porticoccaceae bacterium]|tara:strand:+ start:2702 stop:2986 length:285 start_codon:yes stop_codon:yes gene_type:complete